MVDPLTIGDLSEDGTHLREHQKIENFTQEQFNAAIRGGVSVGKSGTIPASGADIADVPSMVPYDMTAQKIAVVRKAHASAAMAVQPRLSTDESVSYADTMEVITFDATGLYKIATLATEVDLNEGELLNMSVSSGGGTTVVLYVLGEKR